MYAAAIFGNGTISIDAAMPLSMAAEALQPTGDGPVELYELRLIPSGVIFFKENDTVTWQGNRYDGLALRLTGVEANSDGSESRPKLQVVNPGGMFSPFVVAGSLEKAIVIQRTVLRRHLDRNARIFMQRQWYISRVAELTDQSITVEMRELSEGPHFMVPARMYIPPAFPVVSLQ
jgi:lambda family phage minor tail protein L